MARLSVSTEDAIGREGIDTRRTSTSTSNPNVFSDDYAVDNADSIGDHSPVDSIQESADHVSLASQDNNIQEQSKSIPPFSVPNHMSRVDRPSSTSKRLAPGSSMPAPHRAVSSVTLSDADIQRSFSASSRFSMPRSQSPYNGPTAPSQPYAMYPQVTRASSIASESTVRPHERPFVSQGGPEHPYAMYQNNVPEEVDDVTPQIPLGFPRMGQSYRDGSSSSGNDIGDIVGMDGHIEQLPPYTRYADNVIAKGDLATIEPSAMAVTEEQLTPPDSGLATSESGIELNPTGARENGDLIARKEGWIQKNKRRRCCGLPLWTVLLISGVIFVATALGGVIGGVVGNEKGVDHGVALGESTTTVTWLDADPVTTGPSTPSCPTGHYTIPLKQTEEIDTCIMNNQYTSAWGCMDVAAIGVSVFDKGPTAPPQVMFDDYSLRPQRFQYGPQPPDFNGTYFDLQPFKDKQDDELGVAMFFSVLFDKLIILRESALPVSDTVKRYASSEQLAKRDAAWGSGSGSGYLEIGDKPWYCLWPSTINEFWIFLDHDMAASTATTGSTSAAITAAPIIGPAASTSASPSIPNESTAATTAAINQYASDPSQSEPTYVPDSTWPPAKAKREFPAVSGPPTFPRLIKMVEKRKPDHNIPPYCQQMQVLNDWQVVSIPNIEIISVEEIDFDPDTSGSKSKRWLGPRRRSDTALDLESNCICEWFSTD